MGASSGPVSGTLTVVGGSQLTFIKTGGPLAADTYTVTLRSAADGIVSADGSMLLDGNGDGTEGDDYSAEFTMAPPAGAVTVSVPDIVRGPGQDVNVPADGTTGLPLSLSEGTGVRDVTLSIDYDPAMLEITGATVAAGMPAGATVSVDTSVAGTAVVTFSSPADLPAGATTFANLIATVPTANANEIYLSKQVLDLHSITITDSSSATIPSIDDDGLHVSEYLSDVSGMLG